MAADELEDLKAVLPPLLQSLEALDFIARFLDPPQFAAVLAAAGEPDAALAAALPRIEAWPDELAGVRGPLETASRETLAGFTALRGADRLIDVFRALRHGPLAQEALYPLAEGLPPVNRFFLEPAARQDAERQARALGPAGADSGVSHLGESPGARGGCSIYAPEYYCPERAWPLVIALHGGSGNGRAFLWSWLRAARTHGAIVIAATAIGQTWALNGPDVDTPNLANMIEFARGRWNVDPARILLTGMSDGATFSYLAGLTTDLPVTHLAPVSAAFHPLMVQVADPARVQGLPIYLVHGARDWMFPVETARQAHQALAAAGAAVTYRELDNLSHTYPREESAAMLEWMSARAGAGE
jgi:phospholipase/carboxylesterase